MSSSDKDEHLLFAQTAFSNQCQIRDKHEACSTLTSEDMDVREVGEQLKDLTLQPQIETDLLQYSVRVWLQLGMITIIPKLEVLVA